MRYLRPQLVLLLLPGFLSACGGGGGGGSGSSSPPPAPEPPIVEPSAPVVTYTGNRQRITITQSNAAVLASRIFSIRGLTLFVESQWTDPPLGPADTQETVQGQISGTAALRAEVDASGRGYLEAVFENFSDNPGEVLNGRFVQRTRPVAGVPAGIDFSFAGPGSLEFDGFSVSVDQDELSLQGVVEISGVDSNTFLVNLIVSQPSAGELLYFENCTIRFSEVSVFGAPRPAVDLSGSVFEQAEGGVEFTSLGAVPDLGANELAGYVVGGAGGGIEILADGPTTHVRPISFAFASVVMDIDGDGMPETARRYSWPELSGETVVESSVFAGPIANAGTGRTVTVGDPTSMHGLFSHDDDGDWLTFDWALVSKPWSSSVVIDEIASQPFFDFTPDEPGDYVFRLRATDGADSSEVSVIVRSESEALVSTDDEPSGALEIGQPIAASTPILIDATSAISWPYGENVPSWTRGGFGLHNFEDTGSPTSTYLTVDEEGLNDISFTQNGEFAGAPSSDADVTLAVGLPIFETRTEVPGENALDVHTPDYDADGNRDLALRVGLADAARLRIFLATPDGFTPGPNVPAGSGEIAYGDVNEDGRVDFLNAADDGLLLFTQAADGALSAPLEINFPVTDCALTGGPTDIGLVDVDGAGRLDIVAVHPCEDAIVTWLQQPDASFASPTLIRFEDHRVISAAFGDVNSDGRADYAASISAKTTDFDSGVSILTTQPDGTVIEEVFVLKDNIGRQGVTIGDIDTDARHDVIVVNFDEIVLLKQQADGSLVRSTIYSDSEGPSFQPAVSLIDLNDDGLKDVYFCNNGPSARLLVQRAGGAFDVAHGPRCQYFDLDQPEIAARLDWNGNDDTALVTLAENGLLNAFLQGVRLYPTQVTE